MAEEDSDPFADLASMLDGDDDGDNGAPDDAPASADGAAAEAEEQDDDLFGAPAPAAAAAPASEAHDDGSEAARIAAEDAARLQLEEQSIAPGEPAALRDRPQALGGLAGLHAA